MNAHWEQLCQANSANELVLTDSRAEDDALYRGFRSRFVLKPNYFGASAAEI